MKARTFVTVEVLDIDMTEDEYEGGSVTVALEYSPWLSIPIVKQLLEEAAACLGGDEDGQPDDAREGDE